MEEKDRSRLVMRYEEMLSSGKSIYFDAGEFDELAEYYDAIDESDEAEKIVTDGLQIHPNNHQLMLKKAKLMTHKGFFNQALDFLNQNFTGYDLDLYLLKIECLLCLSLYSEASLLATEAIDNEANEQDILYSELGFLYVENDYFDDGIFFFEESLRHNPANEEVLTELSYAYEMTDNFPAAISTCNKLLDVNPYAYEVWINLGKLYSLQEEYEKAIDAFDFAATIGDCDNDVLKLKAHCLSLCGRVDEAIDIFKEQIKKNREDASAYNSLSECYFSIEQYDEMLYYIDEYEKLKGESIETIAKKAIAYLQKNEYEKVEYYINQGLAIDNDNEDINIVAGEYYFQVENYILAETFFRNVYNQGNKKNGTLLDRLSLISIAQNEINNAIKYLEEFVVLNDDIQTRTRLGLLYFEAGDKKRFTSYVSLFSDSELKHLVSLFFSKEQFNVEEMTRESLINRLNDARECRLLFKNIMY